MTAGFSIRLDEAKITLKNLIKKDPKSFLSLDIIYDLFWRIRIFQKILIFTYFSLFGPLKGTYAEPHMVWL